MKRAALALVAMASVACGGARSVATTFKLKAAEKREAPVAIDGDHNLLYNGDFDEGSKTPWRLSKSAGGAGKASIKDGKLCLDVTSSGKETYDLQLRHRDLNMVKGHRYAFAFEAHANQPTKVRPRIGMTGPPYLEYFASEIPITTEPQRFVGYFTMNGDNDPGAELSFQLGGDLSSGPVEVCFDSVRLDDPEFTPTGRLLAKRAPKVRVNQVGYFIGRPKRATVVHPSKQPVAWQLQSSSGDVLLKGTTKLHGDDRASGDHVHIIDFSKFQTAGSGYKLAVDEKRTSYPFDVRDDLYGALQYEALAYFYHNRSGTPIEAAYVGASHARPAGHTSDKKVECLAALGCDYTLDVSGGWYDAGDHGKYVVNGGISVWTLLNQWERAKHLGSNADKFADGTMKIPEAGNGTPDLLDEARWGLELLLKMQVPKGKYAGMAHHKIHGDKWTDLPLKAHEDPTPRHLHAPSTAATLNLAATAAQAARIYQEYDEAFSERCLKAAEIAWSAARKHPKKIALGSDNVGGGPYGDNDVSDEFYWAAAELFVTTAKDEYKKALAESKHAYKLGAHESAMAWETTQALGTIALALVPNQLDAADKQRARAAIIKTADRYVATIAKEGYLLPLAVNGAGKYNWGSTSNVVNNMIILALAHDWSKKAAHLNGVIDGMDYLLGRNGLAQSYVSGYGEQAVEQVHHRFWAKVKDPKLPAPPPGCLSGGPNSGLEDPVVQKAGLRGCAPQKCFIDDIDAWSANEVTINWNAPFAWVAAYLDEKGRQ